VIEVMVRRICIRIPLRYFRENWGAPFILGFMILLIVAAVSLAGGLDFLANEVAVYAYYLLVAGVFQRSCSRRLDYFASRWVF